MWRRAFKPLLDKNARVYQWINKTSLKQLEKHGHSLVPKGVTANDITTARTSLVFPTLFLFSNGYTVLPALCVVVNVTFDYVDGAVARWQKGTSPSKSNGTMLSARSKRTQETWGAYYDAIADKAFAIPVWLCAFQQFNDSPILQAALLSHAAVEGYSCFVRTKSYFDEPSPATWISGKESNSAVIAGITGKTKQFLAMLGTSFIMVPLTHTLGTALLVVSVPLAIMSVTQKINEIVVYSEIPSSCIVDSKLLNYIEHSRSLGSMLIVGVRESDDSNMDILHSLRLLSSVHSVVQVPKDAKIDDLVKGLNISVKAPIF